MEIARTTSNPDLLRICFENGFLATDWLDCQNLLGNRVISNPSTAWLDVLFDFDFMRWRTDPQQLSGLYQWWCIVDMGPDCTRWWIEHGGHVTRARGLLEFKKTVPDPGTMQILLDRFGIDWFKDSGILQTAAKDDEMESVKMLVDAGADINEYPTDWQSDIREHRAAPLSALQEAMYAKSERMIRYLVEHGATMTLKQLLIPDTFNTLPKEVRDYRDLIVELGGIREENTH